MKKQRQGDFMQKITTILIDMYGVILEESKGNFIPYTYDHFEESAYERLTRQFRSEKLFGKASVGALSSDEFLSLLGYDDPQYHMQNYIENFLTLDPGFIPFAEKYYRAYDFVLLSNDVSEWSAYITGYHQLDKYLRQKIVSGDVKCKKPDREIFEAALAASGKRAEECIFVDNSVKNLEAAAALGIIPVLFNRDGAEYAGTTVNTFEELAAFMNINA